jgi:glycosyltransferase involved in cell wall biosynthesis
MASFYRKLRKLVRDPIAYCLDSKHKFLRTHGQRLFDRQSKRYLAVGAANAHRKITVVMTAYNTSHLVEAAVKSVLAQSHKNFELMVIDDDSSDDTLEVLKSLAATDARVRIFHSPTNHGTYWSKNWCLSQADGEFVAFHDSDDRSEPKRLQSQLGAMLEGAGADAVTCHWRRVDGDGNPLIIDGTTSRMAAISLMIRRQKVIEEAGFFDSVRISADTEFIRRLHIIFGKARVRYTRQILYIGLLRDGSLTRSENSGFIWKADGRSYVRELSGDRAAYHQAFMAFHDQNLTDIGVLKIAFPITKRHYATPVGITKGCGDQDTDSVQEIFVGTGTETGTGTGADSPEAERVKAV